MRQSISTRLQSMQIQKKARDTMARVICGSMLLMSGAAHSQEFVDKIKNAKTLDTSSLRNSAKTGADNIGFVVQLVGIVGGLVFFIWGILWVMSAQRSEGRKNAAPGWFMIIGGGALGAATLLYALVVGTFSGISS